MPKGLRLPRHGLAGVQKLDHESTFAAVLGDALAAEVALDEVSLAEDGHDLRASWQARTVAEDSRVALNVRVQLALQTIHDGGDVRPASDFEPVPVELASVPGLGAAAGCDIEDCGRHSEQAGRYQKA